MAIGKVDICGLDTSSMPLLCEKEKTALLQRVNNGDMAAREQLINGNLRLVLSVIQRFSGRGESPDDLFQVGCVGLMKAIDNFDLSHGVKFSTYAVPMIMGELRRYLRDYNSVRVSRSMKDLAYKTMKEKEEFQNKYGRQPSIKEIADIISVSSADIAVALEAVTDPVSFSEPIYSENGDAVLVDEQLSDTDCEKDWICSLSLRETITGLSKREQDILSLRFIKGYTQVEVAKKIGISQAQVSRLEKNSLNAIKSAMQE